MESPWDAITRELLPVDARTRLRRWKTIKRSQRLYYNVLSNCCKYGLVRSSESRSKPSIATVIASARTKELEVGAR